MLITYNISQIYIIWYDVSSSWLFRWRIIKHHNPPFGLTLLRIPKPQYFISLLDRLSAPLIGLLMPSRFNTRFLICHGDKENLHEKGGIIFHIRSRSRFSPIRSSFRFAKAFCIIIFAILESFSVLSDQIIQFHRKWRLISIQSHGTS